MGRNGNPHGFCWNAEQPIFLARLAAVNGVVIPSLLNPGQRPIQTPYMRDLKKKASKGRDRGWQKYCLICDDVFNRREHLKVHFVPCVERNGNPHGYRWDDLLEGRIGTETSGLHCEEDGGRDQGTQASTSEVVSSDNSHKTSDQPSESCNTSQSSGPRSLALLRHESDDYNKGPLVARTETDHGSRSAVIELSDEEAADMDIGTAQAHVC